MSNVPHCPICNRILIRGTSVLGGSAMECPLHAAAPALLEALERACDSVAPDRFGDGRPTWYDEARAGIAQARQEAK